MTEFKSILTTYGPEITQKLDGMSWEPNLLKQC